jgi:hypothetical protein
MAFAFLADYSPPQSDGVTRQDLNMREVAAEEKNGYVVIIICLYTNQLWIRVIVGGGGEVFLYPSHPFLQQVFHKMVNDDVTVLFFCRIFLHGIQVELEKLRNDADI